MTSSSSGITEVARSREKFDRQTTVDLPALEDEELGRGTHKNRANAPRENNNSTFQQRLPRKRNSVIALVAIVSLIILPAYADRALRGSTIAHGVSIAGINVGGASTAHARTLLSQHSKKALSTPITFTLGKDKVSVSSQDLGLVYDIDGTLNRARHIGRTYNPISAVSGFAQRYSVGHNVAPVVKYDAKKFSTVATSLVNEFSRGRTNAGVTVHGTHVSLIKAKNGQGVTLKQASAALHNSMTTFSRTTHALHQEKVDAQISFAQAQKTAATLRTMLNANSVLTTPAGNSVTITPAQLSSSLVITPENSQLVLSIDTTKIRSVLADQLTSVEVPATNASFSTNGSQVNIVPSVAGKQIDFASALTHWIKGEHTFAASVTDVQPAHDTAWAQKLNITELVSSYTTNFPAGQDRIKNIRRAAQVVDNTIVVPNQIFSLNDTLGRRTAENGYVKAPVFSDEQGFFDDYGGGASQFSTTLFNAVFVGGYKDITHSPHSIYISRYPEGRDATLNYGSIDMKFQDDSHSGMLIRTYVGPTSVTVNVYGNKEGRTVTLEGPTELGRTPIGQKFTDDPTLDAGKQITTTHGYPGIVVVNYRTVDRPGKPGKKETYRWTYEMVPDQVRRGTKPVAPPA